MYETIETFDLRW